MIKTLRAGKSFTAKEEMTNIILSDPNADVIIIDPEREYSPLVKAMQAEVIHISATSENHINAMDMNSDYGDGANPVILKSEFILSLCEQLISGASLGARQKSIIDRCTANIRRIKTPFAALFCTTVDMEKGMGLFPVPESVSQP